MNKYYIIIIVILLFIIIKKICNLNKPFDENKFIKQINNQKKLKKNFSLKNIKTNLPTLTSYYIGLTK